LKYYVGSNTRGRTFLFEIEGFLYQSPINYYAAKDRWDMSPGYSRLVAMELNHPVDSTCLFCHASRVQAPAKGTVNQFAGDAFLQPGVGCERCHGPGSDHVAGRGPMVNPARLAGDRRDSVCIQCHLEGEARIATAGRTQDLYTPGESLSDSLAIFVRDNAAIDRLGAVSHVEALALSMCKRGSGDALACITCHDPHVQPGASEKPRYYRAKCIGCHAALAENHHPRQQDCTSCHMPRSDSADIGHTMVTDHRIPRLERTHRTAASPVRRLVEFGGRTPRDRELGLAYGEVALRGNEFAAREALRLLEGVLPRFEHDPDVLTRLGHLYQMQGNLDRAERLYDRALKAAPDRAVVAANLGVLNARRGSLSRALEIWRDAFAGNPQLSDLGLNLANGLCAAGNTEGARDVARRVLTHNPDHAGALDLLATITNRGCEAN
jgi:Flp pilus assembly protein TadD